MSVGAKARGFKAATKGKCAFRERRARFFTAFRTRRHQILSAAPGSWNEPAAWPLRITMMRSQIPMSSSKSKGIRMTAGVRGSAHAKQNLWCRNPVHVWAGRQGGPSPGWLTGSFTEHAKAVHRTARFVQNPAQTDHWPRTFTKGLGLRKRWPFPLTPATPGTPPAL